MQEQSLTAVFGAARAGSCIGDMIMVFVEEILVLVWTTLMILSP